jgi:hypothetical protein
MTGWGDLVQHFHHLAADVEEVLIEDALPPDHLAKVVPRGEGHARCLDHDHAHRSIRAGLPESGHDLLHEGHAQGVAFFRPVETDGRNGSLLLQDKVLKFHLPHLLDVAGGLFAYSAGSGSGVP